MGRKNENMDPRGFDRKCRGAGDAADAADAADA